VTKGLINEKILCDLLSKDDKQAFDEIYNYFWASMFDNAYKRLKNKEQCKDIVQDIFTDLWIKRGTVKIENLGAYLFTAVRYQVIKYAAQNKAPASFFEIYESIAVSPLTADSNLENKEIEELIQSWLNSLPEKRRKVLMLRYRNDFSSKDIADQLKISQKTVQNQLGRAFEGFRKKFRVLSFLTVLNFF